MIKFSQSTINDIYFGNLNISKVYFGNTLIFEKENLQQLLYEFTKELETIYDTKEKPVKSAILSGSTKYRDISSNKIYDSYETATKVWSTNKYKLWCSQDSGTTSKLNGTIASGADIVTLDFHVINHSTYKLTGNCTYKKVVFYDSNQTFISSMRTSGTTNDLVVNNIPSNARYVRFSFFPYTDNTGRCSIVDENNNPIILRQIQLISCKMPVLTTVGKNLFDKTKIIFDKLIDLYTGDITDYSLSNMTEFIKVIPNTQYTMSFNFETNAWTRCFGLTEAEHGKYATDVNGISDKCYFDSSSKKITFTTSPTTKYLIFMFGKGVEESFQLEQGSTATPYETYKSNILTVNGNVELRGIGDVRDELNCLTGEVTERIGEIVLDGSESWSILAKFSNGDCKAYSLTINDYTSNIVCDGLKILPNDLKYGIDEGMFVNNNLLIVKKNITTIELFKQWLSQNPLTVQYQLETESIKTVDLTTVDQEGNNISKLKTFNDITHIEVKSETAVLPTVSLKILVDSNAIQNEIQNSVQSVSEAQNSISSTQANIEETINNQSQDTETTMIGVTEVYEKSIE